MNQELKKLYLQYQQEFQKVSDMNDEKNHIHGPFLISPDDKYFNQQKKIMIVGKETFGWSKHGGNIDLAMEHYREFNLGSKYYSSPFWNITRKIETTFDIEPYSCAWGNLNKFDVNQGTPFGIYLEEISKLDKLLLEEIHILKPDNIIFFTGPALDYRIKNIFKDIVFEPIEGFSRNQLCRLTHPELPLNTWRTYHPNYIRRSGLEQKLLSFFKKES